MPPRRNFGTADKAVKLPAKLIQDAKAGDPNKLRELASVVETSGHNADALDACLTHLQAEALHRPHCDIASPGIFNLRWASITCLHRITRFYATGHEVDQALKAATVGLLADSFEGITAWMDLVVSGPLRDDCVTPNMLMNMADILRVMLFIDEHLRSLILYSSNVIGLCLKLWSGIIRNDNRSLVDINEEDGSPIVDLMFCLVEFAPEVVHVGVLSLPKPGQIRFSRALVGRFVQLRTWGPTSQYPENRVAEYATALRTVAIALVSHPGVEVRLRKEGYLYSWAKAITELHNRLKGRLRNVILELTFGVLSAARGAHSNPVHNIFEMLEAEIFSVVFDLFRTESPPRDKDKREGGILLWSAYLAYAYYPRTLDIISKAGAAFPQSKIDPILKKGHLNPDWRRWMAAINQGYRIENLIDCTPPPLDRHCDNAKHQPWLDVDPKSKECPVKACSGCHTVLYCSVDCQKEDWKARHYRECRTMRHSYFDRRARKVRYTANMRFFHVATITETLNKTPPNVLFADCRRRWPGKSLTEFVAISNFSGGKHGSGGRAILPLDIYYSKASANLGDCAAMNERSREMVDYFQDHPPSAQVCLTEASFSWNEDVSVFVMTAHQYDESVKKWQLGRCIVRFGH